MLALAAGGALAAPRGSLDKEAIWRARVAGARVAVVARVPLRHNVLRNVDCGDVAGAYVWQP